MRPQARTPSYSDPPRWIRQAGGFSLVEGQPGRQTDERAVHERAAHERAAHERAVHILGSNFFFTIVINLASNLPPFEGTPAPLPQYFTELVAILTSSLLFCHLLQRLRSLLLVGLECWTLSKNMADDAAYVVHRRVGGRRSQSVTTL